MKIVNDVIPFLKYGHNSTVLIVIRLHFNYTAMMAPQKFRVNLLILELIEKLEIRVNMMFIVQPW